MRENAFEKDETLLNPQRSEIKPIGNSVSVKRRDALRMRLVNIY